MSLTHPPHPPAVSQLAWSEPTRGPVPPRRPGSKPVAQARCAPRPRSPCPLHPPLQHGWQPPASCSSSDGAGGIWIACELGEEANKHLALGSMEKGTPEPSPSGCRAPSVPILPLKAIPIKKMNSPALPWLFLRALPGQIIRAPRGTTLSSLVTSRGRTGRGKNPWGLYTESSRPPGFNTPAPPS